VKYTPGVISGAKDAAAKTMANKMEMGRGMLLGRVARFAWWKGGGVGAMGRGVNGGGAGIGERSEAGQDRVTANPPSTRAGAPSRALPFRNRTAPLWDCVALP